MKKYKEANRWINELLSHPDWAHCDIEWEAIDEIKEALSLVTPKSIVMKTVNYSNNVCCPSCGYTLAKRYSKDKEEEFYSPICKYCGQKLKW